MDAASELEYVTALAPEREQVTASSSSGFVTAMEQQIERSKRHWSELAEPHSMSISIDEEAAAAIDNKEVFESLREHPEWGGFFWGLDDFEELEVGEKFAEGGQAELYHAHVKWWDPKKNEEDLEHGCEYVMKVFKNGTLVRHLQPQWPHGLFKNFAKDVELTRLGNSLGKRYNCDIVCATLLEDGRFAFVMVKEQEDLRTLIDREMLEIDLDCGPFTKGATQEFMYMVAEGMDELHSLDIIHRDLKASNVLHTEDEESWFCIVADFECSIGVVGTGFWRAPKILQACKDKNVNKRPNLFTRAADAYSYGMTCYEILTGKLPFQDDDVTMSSVIQGQRPEVPEFVDDWAHELLHWCWQSDPTTRPSFEEILGFLEAIQIQSLLEKKQ